MESGSLYVFNICVLLITLRFSCGSTDSVCSNNHAIGVSNRSIVLDSSMTASSYYNDDKTSSPLYSHNYKPSNGRLHGMFGWIPRDNKNPKDYLLIDLAKAHVICGVATQGGYGWVTQYKLSITTDIYSTWKIIDKLFTGNTDENSVVKNMLPTKVKARYIRFIPTTYSMYKSLRVEVYVVSSEDIVPVITAVNASSSTSINLKWRMKSDQRIDALSFTVAYTQQSGRKQTRNVGNVTTYTLTNLQKYTNYDITVTANIKDGNSRFGFTSTTKSLKTLEDAPVCAPMLTSVTAVSSTSIRVTWTPPPNTKCRNGALKGYKVAYRLNRRGSRMKYLDVKGGRATTTVVSGLGKYTEYSFQVLAYTVRDGPLSTALVRRTNEDAPVCAPSLTSVTASSSTSIRVTWTPPPNNKCRNGALKGYKVAYRLNRRGSRMKYHDVKGGRATTTVVSGLGKYTEYSFQVLAYTVRDGPLSTALVRRTKEDAPQCAPKWAYATVISSTRVRITWTPLPNTKCRNGVLRGYKVAYRLNRQGSTMKYHDVKGDRPTTTVVSGLGKYTWYSFQVLAYTVKDGPLSTALVIRRTKEDVPDGCPQQVSTYKINQTSHNMTWNSVLKRLANGLIGKYEVKRTLVRKGKKVVQNNQRTFNVTSKVFQYVFHGLELCAEYNVSVRAYTSQGPGPYSNPVSIITQRPGPPERLELSGPSTSTVRLRWLKPTGVSNGNFTIQYKGSKLYWKTWPTHTHTSIYTMNGILKPKLLIKKLVPGTRYEFWVYATTECGNSPKIGAITTTVVGDPLAVDIATVKYHNDTDTVVNVTLLKARQQNGPISTYQVIAARSSNRLPSNYSQALYNYTTAVQKRLSYYITAEVTAELLEYNRVLTIGDGTIYKHKYTNVALDKGKQYHIYQRAVTYYQGKTYNGKEALVAYIRVAGDDAVSKAKSTESAGPGGAIGAVFGVIIVLCLVGAGVFYWRRRRHGTSDKQLQLQVLANGSVQDGNTEAGYENVTSESRSISVKQFPAYIASVKANDYASLRSEYKSVPNNNSACIVATLPVNKQKNRYRNIVAYDHSRVVIGKVKGDENSDYINASFIHGCGQKSNVYIATQGPSTQTFDDFWRMIWEQSVGSIVMLTNLIELGKRKCHQYWPDDSAQYAYIKVTNHKTEVFADYVIRTFNVTKAGTSRKVVQFHFTAWPDKGVPQHATSLLAFRRKVRAQSAVNAAPTVIHCSAGVGRTGAYIMVDALLEQAEKEKCVDMMSCIHSLRKDRPSMVQTEDQYIFVHIALYEAIFCGNTEIQVHNLRIATQKLATVDPIEKASGYSLQFKRLGEVTGQEQEDDSDVGRTKINAKKNRYPDIVPINRYRVVLKTEQEGEENYFNATFVDTYRDRNAFIVTQAPLKNTVVDFWRMVMDYDIGTIVMLNNLQEGDETFVKYWPNKGCDKYGDIEVELLETQEHVGFVSRKLKVTRQQSSRTIKHFQHNTWVDKCVPANPQIVLQLLDEVQRSQHRCANAPILVQCSNGVGRCGTFCAIASTLERVKQEQVMDVFQTVKSIRGNRPGAVQTLTQYVFCYQIVQKYLDSFSDYANFNG